MTIEPMTCSSIEALVERGYINSGCFTWAREVLVNSLEAGAKHVDFGVEWQGVAKHGVYRRLIADDGCGMSADELRHYLNTLVCGAKTIGPRIANFGVGAKTSLLPWNRMGLVVLSYQHGEGSMVRLECDHKGRYGLHHFEALSEDGARIRETVINPGFDPELGIDFAQTKPDWITDHGTILVLLGNHEKQNTFSGDPARREDGLRSLANFLNERFWDLQNISVRMMEMKKVDPNLWPQFPHDRDRWQWRTITGAKYFVATPSTRPQSTLHSDTVVLSDGTEIDWYLWDDYAYRGDYGPDAGTISLAFQGEQYDVSNHHSKFRSFGVFEESVRKRVFLVIRPKIWDDVTRTGVWSQPERIRLRWGDLGDDPPIADWAEEFREKMPLAIQEALKQCRSGKVGPISDDLKKRLSSQFGQRFNAPPLQPDDKGEEKCGEPDIPGRAPGGSSNEGGGEGGAGGKRHREQGDLKLNNFARPGKPLTAKRSRLSLEVPDFAWVDDSLDENCSFAVYNPPVSGVNDLGLVHGWRGHPVFRQIVEYHQKQYRGAWPDEVQKVVEEAYSADLRCRVAHICCQMRRYRSEQDVLEKLLSPDALTASSFGLYSLDAVINAMLRNTIGKRPKLKVVS